MAPRRHETSPAEQAKTNIEELLDVLPFVAGNDEKTRRQIFDAMKRNEADIPKEMKN